MTLLLSASPDRWLQTALSDLDTLLLDHAHCEKKAASTVLAFVFRHPELEMAGALSRMAREELTHFEMALRELRRRGLPFTKLPPAAYAGKMASPIRAKETRTALLDGFIVAALIEARSHERMALLAANVADPELRAFYGALCPAEERHAELMLDCAKQFGEIDERLGFFARLESELIQAGEPLVRMHA